MFNKVRVLALMTIAVIGSALLGGGCYCNAWVAENQVGLRMPDGVTIAESGGVVGAGRYTDLGFYSDIESIDVSAKTLIWEDPDLVTADKQPIGLQLGVTYARMRGGDSVREMWRRYNAEAISDDTLAIQVNNRIARVAKQVTAKYNLNEMLGVEGEEKAGRQAVANDLFNLLKPELAEFHVELYDVGINNIGPSQEYLDLLEQKANAQVAVEVAREKTKQLNEQLEQEKAQTQIDVEKAKRQNLVNEELSKVYEQSPQYYELERLKLLKDVIGDSDKMYFVPEGSDLTLILGGSGVIPVKPVD